MSFRDALGLLGEPLHVDGRWRVRAHPVSTRTERVGQRKRASVEAPKHLVARTRFELVISALRGRRPEPLDERAMRE